MPPAAHVRSRLVRRDGEKPRTEGSRSNPADRRRRVVVAFMASVVVDEEKDGERLEATRLCREGGGVGSGRTEKLVLEGERETQEVQFAKGGGEG